MPPLSSVAGMALVLMVALMLVSYLKEGGTLRTFGAFVFSYINHKALSFIGTWLMLTGIMSIMLRALLT